MGIKRCNSQFLSANVSILGRINFFPAFNSQLFEFQKASKKRYFFQILLELKIVSLKRIAKLLKPRGNRGQLWLPLIIIRTSILSKNNHDVEGFVSLVAKLITRSLKWEFIWENVVVAPKRECVCIKMQTTPQNKSST